MRPRNSFVCRPPTAADVSVWRSANPPAIGNRPSLSVRAGLPCSNSKKTLLFQLRDLKLLARSLAWIQIGPCPTSPASQARSSWSVEAAIPSTAHHLLFSRSALESAAFTGTECLDRLPAHARWPSYFACNSQTPPPTVCWRACCLW